SVSNSPGRRRPLLQDASIPKLRYLAGGGRKPNKTARIPAQPGPVPLLSVQSRDARNSAIQTGCTVNACIPATAMNYASVLAGLRLNGALPLSSSSHKPGGAT